MGTNRKVSTWSVGITLFALAFSVRLAYVLIAHTSSNLLGGCEMERAAKGLAFQGDIVDAYGPHTGPTAHVAPLYPMVLAQVYRVFGYKTFTGNFVQQLLAILATSLGLGLLPLIARRCGLRFGAALTAGIVLAVCPFNLWVETSGTWEQPYAALALTLLLLVFANLHNDGWHSGWRAGLAGLVLGLSGLLNPNLLFAGGLMLASEFATQAGLRKRVLGLGAIVLLIAAVCLAPWTIRNYCVLGGFVPVRSNFALELRIGNNPDANGLTFIPHSESDNRRNYHPSDLTERARYQALGELPYMRLQQQEALDWVRHEPLRFACLTVRRFQLYWLPTSDAWSPDVSLRGPRAVFSSMVGLGGLLGLAWQVRRGTSSRWLLVAAVLGPSAVYFITHVNPRYAYPTFALAAVIACDLWLSILPGMRDNVLKLLVLHGVRFAPPTAREGV
jgi:hypothetical protein